MRSLLLALATLVLPLASALAAELPVNDAALASQDATLTRLDSRLRLETAHAKPYPGLTLPARDRRWDLSPFQSVVVDITNLDPAPLTVYLRVDNPGADGIANCVTGRLVIQPGQTAPLRADLQRKSPPGIVLFGMRGYPPGFSPSKSAVDPANITQVIVYLDKPTANHRFELSNLRAEGAYAATPARPESFFPFIDTFGQYRHADWPGKVHSLDELRARRESEARDLQAHPSPPGWNKYGGWEAGPSLRATGFFRTEKHAGKWWLVDPDGKLFFSHGIDCVGMLDITPIDGREHWFADFPGADPDLAEFIRPAAFALHGHYAGKSPRCFGFAAANLKRKYGPDWRALTASLAHQRLRSWGLNTIANWSDASITRLRRTPYTATIGWQSPLLEGSEGYWGKFRDVFDPAFAANLRERLAREANRTANDPWCIGYFVDNEIAWGDDTSLAVAALRSPPTQPAKKAFIEDLKSRYATIDRLNAAWGTSHASWDALLQSRAAPDPARARPDLTAFYTRSAELYFRTIRDAIKQVAPNQLYLGCRFAWVNPLAASAAAKYCDVVSYNIYKPSVADFRFNGNADVPLIIGEFHFGALDRGMFHTGLVKTASQADRAATYQSYVQGAARHPQFVGCHWFQYQDEPTTGRVYDEENYQIGFIDIADTPYAETIQASRTTAATLYPLRLK